MASKIIGYLMILIPFFIIFVLAFQYEIKRRGIWEFVKYISTLLLIFVWIGVALYLIEFWE